ncbi:MAG: DUF2490 domain-containing protein [Lutibacter sp.]|nr:DUF2490 domain-containing protein [Lutibacter sp.]MDP3944988.1 DUF2490 domain-containing protein [Lutibacter sp.]
MNKTYPKRLMYLMIFSIFISQGVKSQDLTNEFKIWYGINVNTKINKNFKLKFGAMLAENTNPSSFSFAQGKLGLSYKIQKNTFVEVGYVKELLNDSQKKRDLYDITPGLFNKLEFDRIYTSFSFKHDLVKRLSFKHELEAQLSMPAVQKYKSRYIYSGKLAYNIKKSSITPYLENQVYYYAGGDISGGIKRYRLVSGIQFKPINDFPLSTSLYYLYQNEFNTSPLSENDYTAAGISLTFSIN